MTEAVSAPPCEPFFLPAEFGRRFCLYFPPATVHPRATVIHVPAFGEEMNKARRMVTLQARAMAKSGLGVLLVDLYGCGDSSGEFADGRWEIWKEDLANALRWLKGREDVPVILWGLRLGVLLLMDYAKDSGEIFESFLLWQPVVSGEAFLTQFLRLRLASDMMAVGKAKAGTRELRAMLRAGESLEIAGYELSPMLAMALDKRRLVDMAIPGTPCHWFEVAAGDTGSVSPASRRVLGEWAGLGVESDSRVLMGEPFWMTQEITECQPLLNATSHIFSATTK